MGESHDLYVSFVNTEQGTRVTARRGCNGPRFSETQFPCILSHAEQVAMNTFLRETAQLIDGYAAFPAAAADSPGERETESETALLEAAWGLLANVSEGFWDRDIPEWGKECTRKWRERYFAHLAALPAAAPTGGRGEDANLLDGAAKYIEDMTADLNFDVPEPELSQAKACRRIAAALRAGAAAPNDAE